MRRLALVATATAWLFLLDAGVPGTGPRGQCVDTDDQCDGGSPLCGDCGLCPCCLHTHPPATPAPPIAIALLAPDPAFEHVRQAQSAPVEPLPRGLLRVPRPRIG